MHYISIIIVFHFSFYPLTHRILHLLTSSHLVSLVTPTVWSSSAGHSYCFYNASPFKDWDSPRKKKLSERITVEPALSFLVPKSSIKSWDYRKKWRWVDMWPTYCSQSRCSSNMGKKKKHKDTSYLRDWCPEGGDVCQDTSHHSSNIFRRIRNPPKTQD